MNLKSWKKEIRANILKILLAFLLLSVAIVADYYSGSYTTQNQNTQSSTDLVLDHIPPINLSPIFIWGYIIILAVFFIYPWIFNPKKISYSVVLISLLIIIRALFIIFTHLRTPDEAIYSPFPWIIGGLRFKNDMFFSGHTALAFLGFFVFKENKWVRYFFLIAAILMGATVLLMHQHYSIDVLAAYFITYGIYKIGNKLFNI